MGLERVYIDQNDFISIELFSDDEVYILRDSSSREFIGISVLSVHDTNPIRFKVVDKYQEHGYGKQILKESLEIMKNKGYDKVVFTVKRSDAILIKVIHDLGGEFLSNRGDLAQYVIYLD